MNDLDRAFLLPTKVLDFATARARALSTNLAHASEKGYRRVDVDFSGLVDAARAAGERRDPAALAKAVPELKVDANAPIGANNNTADFEREQVQLDKNALLHELTTFFVSSKLASLRAAIRGQGG